MAEKVAEYQAVLSLNSADFTKGMKDAESDFGKFKSNLINTGKGIATGITAALAGASVAIGAIGKSAIEAYADYEQLIGGVETLFKDSADSVIKNAEAAYTTAGLSANAYMETVTSVSASLLQSLGNDTVAAAAKADMAIIDMADNANKMGTAMESIQNAYQGFAKQNFTMLDNLKLGYGGTKEEMARLLAYAQAISGIEYDISSYADIVDAIHVIQTEMGITGTTAKESSTTIQGSLASMKAAWTNLLTGLTDESQDFDKLIDNLFNTITTFGDNIIPRISVVLDGVTTLITSLAPKLVAEIPGILNTLLPSLTSGAVALVNALVSSLPGIIAPLMECLPTLISGVEDILNGLISALPDLLILLVDMVIEIAPMIVNALISMLPEFINATLDIINGIANSIATAAPTLIASIPTIIMSLVDTIIGALPQFIESAKTIITGIVNALPGLITMITGMLPTLIDTIVSGILDLLPVVLDGIVSIVDGIVNALPDIITSIVDMLPDRDMMRWLNRRDFHIFRPMLNESTKAFYYNASFNVEKIEAKYQGENAIMKLRLTMFTDKPFAYGVEDKRTIETTRTNTLKEHLVTCFSDEVGDVPAHVKITCNAAGDISIKNITNNCTMTITGCTKDEVIEIDGDKQTLKSSTGRNLYKSFNYEFLRLTSAFGTRVNKITVSLPARVEISYRPIIKYGG